MERNGRDYITLAMTGAGIPGKGVGDMDHVAWVTLTEEGPIISNLLLNGVFDKTGADPVMEDALIYRPRSGR